MNANNFTDPQANGAPATADVQRLLPSNREAEEGVLCAMLLDPEAIVPRVFERLDERAFHFPENRVVFRGLVDLYYETSGRDVITLTDLLNSRGDLERAGGPARLMELHGKLPTSAMINEHVAILREKQNRRALIEAGNSAVKNGYDERQPLETSAEALRTTISKIRDANTSAFPSWKDALDLIDEPPPLPPELIDGILHQTSKLVFGGASKSNKTWGQTDMGVSVATGAPWWGFPTVQGRVLYLNLEIPEPFFARRIKTVAEAKGVVLQPGNLVAWNLRGHSCEAGKFIAEILPRVRDGHFSLVILDPIYKLLGGRDESGSGEISSLLNHVEHLAVESGAAVAFGAHYSKGNQSAKDSIDRISGSGVFARDPDSILTLTKHEEEDAFTCEPVLRNHPPHDPFVLRWQYPLMRRDDSLDPAKLKKPKTGRETIHSIADILECLGSDELKTVALQKKTHQEKGMSSGTFYALLKKGASEKKLHKSKITELWSALQ
jgi:hypothetical protein